jgi:hypothetical protein
MLHPSQARVASPVRAASSARRRLTSLARPSASFDARRYFRGADDLRFLNIGTEPVRRMAPDIVRATRDAWGVAEGIAFANALIADRYLEVKGVGIEALACYRRTFTPALLPVWKAWLRETGKVDPRRLQRFSLATRRELLHATRAKTTSEYGR